MYRKIVPLLTMIAALGLLSACSGSAQNKIDVTTSDMHFAPETWTVDAGQPVNVSIKNEGSVEHEWVLIKQGQQVSLPFSEDDEDKVFWEIEAEAGESNAGTFTAPSAPGTYQVVCGIPGHIEEGMLSELVVK